MSTTSIPGPGSQRDPGLDRHAVGTDVAARDRQASIQQILADAASALSATLDPEHILKALARLVVGGSGVAAGTLADYCITYAFEPGDTLRRVGLAHRDPAGQRLLEELALSGPSSYDFPGGVGALLRTGEPVLAADITPAMLERGAQNPEHLRCLRQLQPKSNMVVALRARGRIVGAIALATTSESGRRYGADDLLVAETLAERAALLVDNARLYQKALAAVRARDETVAIVSHDLRSPLATIATGCTVLALDPQAALDAGTPKVMLRATKQMERLVEDLLDVARIEAGGLSLELAPVEVASILAEIASQSPGATAEKQVQVDLAVEPGLPAVWADRGRLCQVLSNLFSNAIKFVPSGGRVELRAEELGEGVRFSVRDTGPGIPPDQLPRLFDRFWQAERAHRGGAGLGLAIAKGIVEAHGGTIEVESALGRGTTFSFVLAAALRAAEVF